MLAIRLQRTGRTGHAQFRFIVQDSRFSPKRGRVVAYLGNYDPHTKTANIDGEKATEYMTKGAQPSDRVARLFKSQGIKLPSWVKLDEPKERTIRHAQKLRKNRPAVEKAVAETPAEEAPAVEAEEVTEPEAPVAEEAPEAEVAEEAQPTEESAATPDETPATEPEVSTEEAPAEAAPEQAPETPAKEA